MLRIGAWSVRRAPGGPEAGLLYVNVETGRAQKEPPQEVLQELDLDEEEAGEAQDDINSGAVADSPPASKGRSSSRPGSSRGGGHSGSRPGTGRRSSGSRPGSSAGSPPAVPKEVPKFRRILLGNSQDLPLRMARDIQNAIKEDVSFFDVAQKRFSDAPEEETPSSLDALPEELEAVAIALAPGELSGVIGTDAGMQIVLRVC